MLLGLDVVLVAHEFLELHKVERVLVPVLPHDLGALFLHGEFLPLLKCKVGHEPFLKQLLEGWILLLHSDCI